MAWCGRWGCQILTGSCSVLRSVLYLSRLLALGREREIWKMIGSKSQATEELFSIHCFIYFFHSSWMLPWDPLLRCFLDIGLSISSLIPGTLLWDSSWNLASFNATEITTYHIKTISVELLPQRWTEPSALVCGTQLHHHPNPSFSFYCCCCSVAQSCLTLCDPMDCGTPGLSSYTFTQMITLKKMEPDLRMENLERSNVTSVLGLL